MRAGGDVGRRIGTKGERNGFSDLGESEKGILGDFCCWKGRLRVRRGTK